MTPDLPVWTIRPNWAQGITERLEWLTDVLASSTGVEQRRAVRLSPRRYIEITVNPTQQERTFLDLILHSLGSAEWLFPLWFDKGRLDARVLPGGLRLDFDNTYREHVEGGLALLYKDAFTWEAVSILAADDNGLDLDLPLDQEWGPGTAIYPLRRAEISGDTKLDALTTRVGESVLLFRMTEANDFPAAMPDDLLYLGAPVMTIAPNRKSAITTEHTRLSIDRDGQVGKTYRVDGAGRAFAVQAHNWLLVGRQAQAEFRSMLYWLRGRQRSVWLPTFNEDVVASRDQAAASLNLDVWKIGYEYAGGPIAGRDLIRIGSNVLKITDTGAPQSPQEERLRIGAGLPQAIPKGRSGSFLDAARLNQDTVELTHHADTNGAMECGATFRTFANIRDATGTIYMPISASSKFAGVCGSAFILENANFELGDVAWQGAFGVRNETPNGQPPVDGANIGWSGVIAVGEFYQTLPIPSRYLAKVDQGLVQVSGFSAYHVTYVSQNDHGHLFIAFLTDSNVEIGRVSSPDDYSKVWTLITVPPAIIPAGTRKLRFGARNIRTEGANNDSYWDAMNPGVLSILG